MSTDPARALLQFFGGRVCLDFANTMDWRTSEAPQELLPDYATFLYWSSKRGVLPAAAVARLRVQGRQRGAAAAVVLEEARALRAEIWTAAEALCGGKAAPPAAFNRRLAALPAQPRLIRSGAGYVHDLPGKSLEEPLWPVLWSLSALLTSGDAGRLGFCQAEGCGWFFVDESPNHARTWCSSEVCGNRERARRAYAKRIRQLPSTAL